MLVAIRTSKDFYESIYPWDDAADELVFGRDAMRAPALPHTREAYQEEAAINKRKRGGRWRIGGVGSKGDSQASKQASKRALHQLLNDEVVKASCSRGVFGLASRPTPPPRSEFGCTCSMAAAASYRSKEGRVEVERLTPAFVSLRRSTCSLPPTTTTTTTTSFCSCNLPACLPVTNYFLDYYFYNYAC